MLVGHYSAAFAIKAFDRKIPLWLLFVAVQLMDILCSIFVLFGIEHLKIVPGFTASNPLNAYFMPYSHGFMANLFWTAITFASAKLIFKFSTRSSLLLSLAVFSHFFFDLLVHVPDLPLSTNESLKVGLGIWNYPAIAIFLEMALLFISLFFYLKNQQGVSKKSKQNLAILLAFLILLTGFAYFGPIPSGVFALSLGGLIVYSSLAGWIHWIESKNA